MNPPTTSSPFNWRAPVVSSAAGARPLVIANPDGAVRVSVIGSLVRICVDAGGDSGWLLTPDNAEDVAAGLLAAAQAARSAHGGGK